MCGIEGIEAKNFVHRERDGESRPMPCILTSLMKGLYIPFGGLCCCCKHVHTPGIYTPYTCARGRARTLGCSYHSSQQALQGSPNELLRKLILCGTKVLLSSLSLYIITSADLSLHCCGVHLVGLLRALTRCGALCAPLAPPISTPLKEA